jgi:hypothetical protein
MKSVNDIRAEYGLPPLPPPDRFWLNWTPVKRISEVRFIMKSKTYSGDLLRMELAWRGLKRVLKYELKPYLKPILDYLK